MDPSSTVRRFSIEVDVGSTMPGGETCVMRGWVMTRSDVSDAVEPVPVIYCQTGGGLGVDSWDLHVDGLVGHSMAEHLVGAGAVVIALDHPGLGLSDPVVDLLALSPRTVVAAHALAVAEIVDRIRAGEVAGVPSRTIRVIGLGHSMGGMLTVMLQAHAACFERLVLLGTAGSGLIDVLTDDERELVGASSDEIQRRITALARRRFAPDSDVPRRRPTHGIFFSDAVPATVRHALAATGVQQLPSCALLAMIPASTAAEMGDVEVPVFLGIGEHDIIAEPHRAIASYTSSGDVRLHVLPGAGHAQNQEPNRHELWRRIDAWIREP